LRHGWAHRGAAYWLVIKTRRLRLDGLADHTKDGCMLSWTALCPAIQMKRRFTHWQHRESQTSNYYHPTTYNKLSTSITDQIKCSSAVNASRYVCAGDFSSDRGAWRGSHCLPADTPSGGSVGHHVFQTMKSSTPPSWSGLPAGCPGTCSLEISAFTASGFPKCCTSLYYIHMPAEAVQVVCGLSKPVYLSRYGT
jgi:hypothetical protein